MPSKDHWKKPRQGGKFGTEKRGNPNLIINE
jgi:hypothetical protein